METNDNCLIVRYNIISTRSVTFAEEELTTIKKFLEENPGMHFADAILRLVMLDLIRNPWTQYDELEEDSCSINIGITNVATGCEAELDGHITAKCALEVLNSD